jgi:cell wall-associated NlpC family hydrolase
VLLTLAACAPFQREVPPPGVPTEPAPLPAAAVVLKVAESRLGAPYRYGGSGPDAFDCSGLVAYAHGKAGIAVPRTAAQQFEAATPVPRTELRPGDLVFFRLSGRAVSHVGIYAGGDRFVHAPQSGGHVRFASLDEEIFRRGYVGAGRFVSSPP